MIRETLGIKLLLLEIVQWIGRKIKKLCGRMCGLIIRHFADGVLFVVFTATVLLMYGTNIINKNDYYTYKIQLKNKKIQ